MSCHRRKQWHRLPAPISAPVARSFLNSGRKDGGPRTAAGVEREVMARGERVVRVVLVVAGGVATFTSTMRGIRRTTVGYRILRISLAVSRWTDGEILWMGMGDIRVLGAIGLLRGTACEFDVHDG